MKKNNVLVAHFISDIWKSAHTLAPHPIIPWRRLLLSGHIVRGCGLAERQYVDRGPNSSNICCSLQLITVLMGCYYPESMWCICQYTTVSKHEGAEEAPPRLSQQNSEIYYKAVHTLWVVNANAESDRCSWNSLVITDESEQSSVAHPYQAFNLSLI